MDFKRSIVNDLKNRLISKGSDDKLQIEIRDSINNLRHSTNQLVQQVNSSTTGNCLSFSYFLIAILFQSVVVAGIIYYRYDFFYILFFEVQILSFLTRFIPDFLVLVKFHMTYLDYLGCFLHFSLLYKLIMTIFQ